jgi:predicted membrane-bound spermidine synthase
MRSTRQTQATDDHLRKKENVPVSGGGAAGVLCGIFFVSGASALIFETLWFQLAGITFGNSVWASSIVLTSFMGGLALGNALAARYGHRIDRPLVTYARIEVVIAVTGVLLILALPRLSAWLVPVFRPLIDSPWLINPLRLLFAFLLMLVPTTAMGLTLPLLVKVLFRTDPSFGKILGRLYGWNTLGAVAGALAGEVALFGWLGLRGTGYVAAGLNLFAAVASLALARTLGVAAGVQVEQRSARVRLSARSWRLLLGSLLAGGILLAFEVVWFRFLQLSVVGTTLSFAVMLATVLAGIGLGGIVASWWLRVHPGAHRFLVAVCLAAGIVAVLVYMGFSPPEEALAGRAADALAIFRLSMFLMFPVSLLSGVLFTLFGEAAQEQIAQETRTAGLLTLANTVGAMIGAVVGGFVLLPALGLERSFFLLGLAYAVVAVCAAELRQWRAPAIHVNGVLAALHLILLVAFPFGSMREHLDEASDFYRERFKSRTVAVREGLTETIQYLRRDFEGEPLNYRLMTNGYSMSGTSLDSKRYMKFFVYWPVAIHPDLQRALLIGYGAGSTAKALTDTARLESIDIVDISRDILELSEVVYPDPQSDPLNDPRVQVRIEDGRYFLQTTTRRFGLITAEPPPPVVGGAVNLYTQEYFQLIHDRLAGGGIVTYWLPVRQMTVHTARSILAAFCNVFEDCSLWSGSKFDWVMVGSRGATGPGSEQRFTEQWRDPVVAPEMKALGFETPEQLGATFIADAQQIDELIRDAFPLTDNRPKRLSLRRAGPDARRQYREWTDTYATQRRFAESSWIRTLWPASLARATLGYFKYQRVANMQVFPDDSNVLSIIDRLLADPKLRTASLWLMDSSVEHERIAARRVAEGNEQGLSRYLGAAALADREYERAADHFARDAEVFPQLTEPLRVYSLCKAGRAQEARAVARRFAATYRRPLNYTCW